MQCKLVWNWIERYGRRGTRFAVLMMVWTMALAAPARAQIDPAGEGAREESASSAIDGADVAADNKALADVTSATTGSFNERVEELWLGLTIRWEMGGPTMYALAFLVVVALLFVIDRLVSLRRGSIAPSGLADKANELWQQGEYEQIIELTGKNDSALSRVIRFIVQHRRARYEPLNSGAEDIATRAFDLHTRRNYPLMVVGTLAPLLGLMGTIFGLMGAFASIGVYGSMDDPSVLAGDIGEAMVTTATGLIIAVPALALYHYFRSRQSRYASLLSEEVSNLMHAWILTSETETSHALGEAVPTLPPRGANGAESPDTSETD